MRSPPSYIWQMDNNMCPPSQDIVRDSFTAPNPLCPAFSWPPPTTRQPLVLSPPLWFRLFQNVNSWDCTACSLSGLPWLLVGALKPPLSPCLRAHFSALRNLPPSGWIDLMAVIFGRYIQVHSWGLLHASWSRGVNSVTSRTLS